jgi:hypothetical protein
MGQIRADRRLCKAGRGGRLAKAKRDLFKEVTDKELAALQNAIQAVMPGRQVDDQAPE